MAFEMSVMIRPAHLARVISNPIVVHGNATGQQRNPATTEQRQGM
jgi:hypothetical protein